MRKGKYAMGILLVLMVAFFVTFGSLTVEGSAVAKIKSIDSINIKLKQYQRYSLPKLVVAFMSDKSARQVAVKWDKSKVNTEVLGKTTIHGTVSGYTRKVVLKILVEPVALSIDDIELTALHHHEFTMPSQVAAVMSDDSERNVDVVWEVKQLNTDELGTMEVHGKVSGYNSKVTLKVQVVPSVERVKDINLEAPYMKPFNLPEKTIATYSDGSEQEINIIWYSSIVDTYSLGLKTYEGNIKDFGGRVHASVTVVPGIERVDDMKITTRYGDKFELPKTVEARYSDGVIKPVEVKWSGNPKVGIDALTTTVYQGEVTGYDKTITLLLQVTPIVTSVPEQLINVKRNGTWQLPQLVEGKLSNNTVKQLPVKWEAAVVDTSKEGRTVVNGTVEYEGLVSKASCAVVVDESAPTVSSLQVLTPTIGQRGTVKIKAKVMDPLSGVDQVTVYYWIEADRNMKEYMLAYDKSSDSWGIDQVLASIETKGLRRLSKIKVIDKIGNWAEIDRKQLTDVAALDFTVVSVTGDNTPPVLKSLTIAPGVYQPGEFIRIKAEITDDNSGAEKVDVMLYSVDNQFALNVELSSMGGDRWEGTAQVNGYQHAGAYGVYSVDCVDKDGNKITFLQGNSLFPNSGSFTIENGKSDSKPPVIEAVDITPVEAVVGTEVKIRVKAKDEDSGINYVMADLKDPSGAFSDWIRLSYNATEDVWEGSFIPKQGDLKGVWQLTAVQAADRAVNTISYSAFEFPVGGNRSFVLK